MKYKYILWDWNGTILNDVDICIKVINKLLYKRNMPLIDKEYYKDIFCFPVIEYYNKLNFDFKKESFEDISIEFMKEYKKESESAELIKDVNLLFDKLNHYGLEQSVLSASYIENLFEQIKRLKVENVFKDILGLKNIHASSKIEIANEWLLRSRLKPAEILLIGDTIHDYETAKELNCDVVLVSYGHQNKKRLALNNVNVFDSVQELDDFFTNNV